MGMKELKSFSVFLYCIALVTPVFFGSNLLGIVALFYGWVGVVSLDLEIGIPWLANVLFIINHLFNKDNLYIKSQIGISLITISFGLYAIGIHDIPRDEGGGADHVTVGIGFIFWILSFVILLLVQVVSFFKTKREILIVDYQDKWAIYYQEIKEILLEVNDNISIEIEHVGSTSVQGMGAKPVIDIDLIYTSQQAFDIIKGNLESIGYFHNGDQGIEDREVFKRAKATNHPILDSISHHLYVCSSDSEELKNHLLFRDHLKSNGSARNQYIKIKLELAIKANQDKKVYAILKEQEATQFVQDCIKKEIENGK
jgi:GrpB-like predicted nucleotidyltransferase (UPF0157 family)